MGATIPISAWSVRWSPSLDMRETRVGQGFGVMAESNCDNCDVVVTPGVTMIAVTERPRLPAQGSIFAGRHCIDLNPIASC
jgi:hypothetical protein